MKGHLHRVRSLGTKNSGHKCLGLEKAKLSSATLWQGGATGTGPQGCHFDATVYVYYLSGAQCEFPKGKFSNCV